MSEQDVTLPEFREEKGWTFKKPFPQNGTLPLFPLIGYLVGRYAPR